MQLTVSVSEGVYILNEEEIIYLQAFSNYTKIYLTENRNIFSAKTLKQYEILLPSNIFYRVHSSFLINSKHICNVNFFGEIVLTQNFSVPISRRKKSFYNYILK
jgi:two-component system, LytTR family, response regulator